MPAHAVERSDPVDGDRGEGECKGARNEGRVDASGCQSLDSHWRRFDAPCLVLAGRGGRPRGLSRGIMISRERGAS